MKGAAGPFVARSLIARTGYHHGLGNRIRVVLGAKILAQREDRRFFFVWPTGPKFGPRLRDLWQTEDHGVSTATSRLLSVRFPYRDGSLTWMGEQTRRERVWQIRTSHALALPADARSWQEEFRGLRPVDAIAERITDIHRRQLAGAPYVGVMVRAHSASHTTTLRTSPLVWYLERMRAIRAQWPDVTFFLSCDLPAAQDEIVAQLGHCVALTDKGAYNSLPGIRSAVTDLYLLAGSGYLLGPHYSSFVELAGYLAGPQLTLETAASPPAGAVDFRSLGVAVDPLRPAVRRPAP